jgi:SAM-dependent methyltransferase
MTAQVMPLHTLDFPDDGFDLVVGRAALDRADLDACRRELARVLRPGGAAVLIEPVCLSPTLRALALAARRPQARASGPLAAARPLHEHHLQRFLDGFEGAERAYFHLAGRFAGRLFPQLAGALSRWDRRILDRFPSMRCFAGVCVLRARKPAPRAEQSGMTAWG